MATESSSGEPPPSSRERLLAAALDEFAARGLAGTRVDAIGRSARVNKQLITYYFGGKEGLYREMLQWCFGQPDQPGVDQSMPLAEQLVSYFDELLSDTRHTRLLQWEALEGETITEQHRRDRYRHLVEAVASRQQDGQLPQDFDDDLLFLTLIATAEYPIAYPQLTEMITGQSPTSPAFAKRYAQHLRRLADHLANEAARLEGQDSNTRTEPARPRKTRSRSTTRPSTE